MKFIYGKDPVHIITGYSSVTQQTDLYLQTFADISETFYETFLTATYLVIFAHVSLVSASENKTLCVQLINDFHTTDALQHAAW